VLEQLEDIKGKLLAPISADQPCGEDPKYEDAYEALKQEIAKMGGMGAGSTDWEMVEKESFNLLAQSAKEINLLAYWSVAMTRNHGLAGMAVGLECAGAVLATFWEPMHPPLKRLKARAGAVSWLQERVNELLPGLESADRELLERASEAATQLKERVFACFEDPPANFRKLRDQLADWLAKAPQPEPEPAAEPEGETEPEAAAPGQGEAAAEAPAKPAAKPPAAAPEKPRAQAPSRPVEAPELPEGADADALYEALGKIAAELRVLAPNRVSPYALQRIALWDEAELPAHNDAKETFFPAPADEVQASLKNMRSKAVWAQLLERAEDLTARWRYWLDLQRYAAEAADQLDYDDVARTIERETKRLTERLPGLADLKFDNGLAFASPETRDWLEGISLAGDGGGSAAAPDAAAELRGAMRQLGTDQFAEAMAAAQTAIDGAINRREALRLRLEAAAFCLEAEQPYWADSLLRALVDEIESARLDYWEPQLAAEAWRLTLETARELKESEEGYLELERRAMRALAALDLGQAGRYPKKKPTY